MTYASVRKVIGGRTKGYICDGCSKLFHWDEDSRWYGSLKDCESATWAKIWFACFPACASKMPEGFPKKANPVIRHLGERIEITKG